MTNLLTAVHSAVQEGRTATAIATDGPTKIAEDGAVTYATLWTLTDRFAKGLRDREITEDDAVAVRLDDPVAFLVTVYGTLRNGSVPVTVPEDYDDREVRNVLEETAANVLVVDDRDPTGLCTRVPGLRVAVTAGTDAMLGVDVGSFLDNDGIARSGRTGITVTPRRDDDRALIAYVGRHGGEPLGIVYSHRCLTARAKAGTELPTGGFGTHLGTLPLDRPLEFVYGATATLLSGGIYRPLPPEQSLTGCKRLESGTIDRTFLTTDVYDEFRRTGIEGAECSVGVVARPTAPTDGLPEDTLYGTPEAGITHVRETGVEDGPSVTPLPDIETARLEDGDGSVLAVAGPTVMNGYQGRPALTDAICRVVDGDRWVGIIRFPEESGSATSGSPS